MKSLLKCSPTYFDASFYWGFEKQKDNIKWRMKMYHSYNRATIKENENTVSYQLR
jgi:hypothetical protein